MFAFRFLFCFSFRFCLILIRYVKVNHYQNKREKKDTDLYQTRIHMRADLFSFPVTALVELDDESEAQRKRRHFSVGILSRACLFFHLKPEIDSSCRLDRAAKGAKSMVIFDLVYGKLYRVRFLSADRVPKGEKSVICSQPSMLRK